MQAGERLDETNATQTRTKTLTPTLTKRPSKVSCFKSRKTNLNVTYSIFSQKFQAKPAYSPKGEIRPLFVNLTAHTAAMGRSPLISLMFPTVKDKV